MPSFLLAAVVVSAIAAVYDVRTGQIPSWLTLGGLFLAPFGHAARAALAAGGDGEAALTEAGLSVLGALACAIVPLVLYRQNALGGGDVKLFAALGAICQVSIGFEALTYSFLAAVLLAPARLVYEGKLLKTLKNTVLLLGNAFVPKAKRRDVDPELMTWFRMGPAIFIGVMVATVLHWRAGP
jgi:prepilin peptidase CpaA